MKKQYESRKKVTRESAEPDDWKLTPAQIRELKRRLKDTDDPVRYLLVSRMGPRFALYYNVSDDVYVMNDPSGGTLFKRRQAAESIREALGPRIRVVKCRTRMRKGARLPIIASLPKTLRR